jgi:hypothetical protein
MPLEHGLSPPRAPGPGQRPVPQGPQKREGRGGGVAHHPLQRGREYGGRRMWPRRQCLTRAGPDGPFRREGSLATPRSRGRRRRPRTRSGGLPYARPKLCSTPSASAAGPPPTDRTRWPACSAGWRGCQPASAAGRRGLPGHHSRGGFRAWCGEPVSACCPFPSSNLHPPTITNTTSHTTHHKQTLQLSS